MMASLPQTPAQTGLASILAALGTAAPANESGVEGGFGQLLANLPIAAPTTPAAANPFGVSTSIQAPNALPVVGASAEADALPAPASTTTPQAVSLFGLPQPVIDTPVDTALPDQTAVKVSTAPAAGTAPAVDAAAAAASLLIAVATPTKATAPANDKAKPVAQDEANAALDGEAAAATPAASVLLPVAAIVDAPVAANTVAAAAPTADKPVAQKASKTTAPAAALRPAESASPTVVGKPAEAATTQQPTTVAVDPKAAKPAVDAAASMTVLFAQPDLQGAAPLAEAAKAAPVAERVLDTASDDQWIAQLAADIAATKSDKGELSFRLMPRHLGRLDVSMLAGDEGVTLRLDTQHEATATIVQTAQPRLVEDLRQQGVRVAEAQVTHTPAEAGRQQMQQHQGQGRGPAPDASHLIETAAERHDSETHERTAGHRGRFA
jgi:flagellar hook-length control protein FliK